MRLLVVEDDSAILDFLKRGLTESGYQVDTARDGKSAQALAADAVYDGFIIDLGLPDMDGLDLIGRCRAPGHTAPVLILSARRSVDERVRGLEQGGDDYLTKPFALAELVARLRNLLRRGPTPLQEAVRLHVADLELDLVRREARRGGQLLQLTTQEFSLLEYLVRNAGRQLRRLNGLDESLLGSRPNPNRFLVRLHLQKEDRILLLTREAWVGDFMRCQLRDLFDETPVQAVTWRLGRYVGQSLSFAAQPGIAACAYVPGDKEVHDGERQCDTDCEGNRRPGGDAPRCGVA